MCVRAATLARHFTSAASKDQPRVAVIFGVGDATGSALARQFVKDGYKVALARRNGAGLAQLVQELGGPLVALASSTDARVEQEVVAFFDRAERELGPVHVTVHNIGANVRFSLLDTTERVFRKVWELTSLSAFLVGREAARRMLSRGQGTIIFTGASAAIRGSPNYAAFAAGMHGKRAVAQSMARELGPQGIHVCHVIVDGPIETKFVKERVGEDTFASLKEAQGLLNPSSIAEAYSFLVKQDKTAWCFEMDLRPSIEPHAS